MQVSILNLDCIKLYYPFLEDNLGKTSTLTKEINCLVSYLLLVDVVIIPPRHFFGGTFGLENIQTANSSRVLRHLIESGRIVTTTSLPIIRDQRDLVEHYSNGSISDDFRIHFYQRDAEVQKQSHIFHLKSHLDNAQYYSNSVKDELNQFFGSNPDHPTILKKVRSIKGDLHPAEYGRLILEAHHGYFSGGSVGNGAIMPSMYSSDCNNSIYNPFYSKQSVEKFSKKLQSLIKKEIYQIPIPTLESLISNLKIFKIMFSELAESYSTYYSRIVKMIGRNRILIRLPTDVLYVSVALLITTFLSDLFTKEMLYGSVIAAYSAKGLYSYINRTWQVTDYFTSRLQSFFRFTGLYDEFGNDLIALTEEFESSIEKTLNH